MMTKVKLRSPTTSLISALVAATVCLSLGSLGAAQPLAITPTPTAAASISAATSNTPPLTDIEAFRLVSPSAGWLLADQRLFWTQDGGHSWDEITPPLETGLTIWAVTFLDARVGWAMLVGAGADGQPQYVLVQTADSGQTWQPHPLALFAPGEAGAEASAVYVQFIDAETGWLVVRQATGSNFSLGSLFRTSDGGQTWLRLTIPIGAPVSFITRDVGWTAGGPAGNELYRTQDGGQSWQAVKPGSLAAVEWTYQTPVFIDAQTGVLPVLIMDESQAQLELHVTVDGGQTWQRAAQAALDQAASPGTQIPLAVFDAQRWMVVASNGLRLVRMSDQGETSAALALPARGTLSALAMVTPEVGWAKQSFSECTRTPQAAQVSGQCTEEVHLLRTEDGGQNWTALPFPTTLTTSSETVSRFTVQTAPARGPGGLSAQSVAQSVQTLTGQGFDTCNVPTATQMQAWMTSSPYKAVNLYIGGSRRACANTTLNADLVRTLTLQGWSFIPTWVGPQAGSIIPLGQTRAEDEGKIQANTAITAAVTLGLALPDQSGTIIYYDLEAYGAQSTPIADRQVIQAFISGWVYQLHLRGYVAGVYGGYGSGITDFVGITNVPDAVWLATLDYTAYDSSVSVFGISWLSDSLWGPPTPTDPSPHQRLRQYANGSDEPSWGGVTLNIDSDVADGPVTTYADITPPVVYTQIYLPYTNSPFRDFQVLLSGSDNLTGIASYDLQYYCAGPNCGPAPTSWGDLATGMTNTAFPFVGEAGNNYHFRARARDNAGNVSAYQGESQHTIPAATPIPADGYEPDNTAAAARPFTLGSTQSHNFHIGGDWDWVTFTAQINQTYLMRTANLGGFADTVIELYNSITATTPITYNDDYLTVGSGSRLLWTAPASGVYYLKVKHFDMYADGATTAYSLYIAQMRKYYLPLLRR